MKPLQPIIFSKLPRLTWNDHCEASKDSKSMDELGGMMNMGATQNHTPDSAERGLLEMLLIAPYDKEKATIYAMCFTVPVD